MPAAPAIPCDKPPKWQTPYDKITHNSEGHHDQVQVLYTKVDSQGNHYLQDWQDKEVCSQGGESISIWNNVVHLLEIPDFLSAQNQQYMNKIQTHKDCRCKPSKPSIPTPIAQKIESEALQAWSMMENKDKTLQNSKIVLHTGDSREYHWPTCGST